MPSTWHVGRPCYEGNSGLINRALEVLNTAGAPGSHFPLTAFNCESRRYRLIASRAHSRNQNDLSDILPILQAQVSLCGLCEWEARIDVRLYLSLAIQNQKPVHCDRQEGIVPKMAEIHPGHAAVLVHQTHG